MRFVGSTMIVIALLTSPGCGDSRPGPSSPSPVPPSGTAVSAAYLEALLEILRKYSINTSVIDWGRFRTEVLAAADPGQTTQDTDRAIGVALRLLNDDQSYYMRGTLTIGPPPVGGCAGTAATMPTVPDTIGYVKVELCDCAGNAATQYAESLQRAIREADRPGLAGWIVDLRGNFGGNMWPMIAGVGPVLGEGIIGWIVYNDRDYEREYIAGGAQSFGEVFARVSAPYTLLKPNPKVALLTDGGVASSGEAIVVYFKGRPLTRSFGMTTCGHHHLQQSFQLSDGATLFLASSQHADRTKRRYASRIEPDEVIVEPGAAVSRAIAWLQGRS